MANREQKRKMEKKNKEKNIKKEEQKKKSFVERKFGLNEEMASFINTLLVVFIGFIIVLLLTLIMGNLGVFDSGYTKPVRGETEISYEEILVGSVFNKNESIYYVVFDNFGDSSYDIYLTQKLNEYSKDIPIYKVDMTKEINAKQKSDISNPSANNVKELKIKVPTLIKIVNGTNSLYIEGTENIINELFK